MNLAQVMELASHKEDEYDWRGAVGLLQKALGLLIKVDSSREGAIHERMGYACFRAGMQAENRTEFREWMNRTIEAYKKAEESYRRSTGSNEKARALRCEAMILYVSYWVASKAVKKKQLLDNCWKLTKESMQAFEEVGYDYECARTYNLLSISARLRLFYTLGFRARERMIKEAVEHGERAIKAFLVARECNALVRAYMATATFLDALVSCLADYNQRERFFQKARDCWAKARELSEEEAILEALSFLIEPHFGLHGGTEEALSVSSRALEYCRKTGDRFVTGWVLDWLSYNTLWRGWTVQDKDERMKLENRALQYAEEARLQYSPLSFRSMRTGVLWIEAPSVEMCCESAQYETNLGKKRELLKTAARAAPALLRQARSSGYIGVKSYAFHTVSKTLVSLAQTASGLRKKELLERALKLRIEVIKTIERNSPYAYQQLIVMYGYVSTIESELAKMTQEVKTRGCILRKALSHVETSIRLCLKQLEFSQEKGFVPQFATLGRCQHQYGDLLGSLYQLTEDRQQLQEAAESFHEASKSFYRANQVNEAAECNWRAARLHDTLGEYHKAAERFETASRDYKAASARDAHLENLYVEYAAYMEAWTEIEKAKRHHLEQEHGLAKAHFEKAANLHKSSKQWSYLAPNCMAWAQVEHAEDLSRNERSLEAGEAFRRAAELFHEAREATRRELGRINDPDELEVANFIFDATYYRREYCLARIALEDARTLDKEGKHSLSSEKYGLAAEAFEKISNTLKSDHEIREFRLIQTLSRAWQKMSQAEAEASPNLYSDASRLFKKAKDYSPNEKTRTLALGHSAFCMALKAGARFADTRDKTAHAVTMQYLNIAINYYLDAGFGKAADYAKATGLLFEAYVHMDSAKIETDPEKKGRIFLVAERILQTSSELYLKAGYEEKSRLVRRLFRGIKEERQVALSLIEVLHAPTISATTASFVTPAPTYERAVGLEKFQHADIQVLLQASEDVEVGEEFEVRLDLVNAGKSPGLLVRLDNFGSEKLKVMTMPPPYVIEDGVIDMTGKRLEPLMVEQIKIRMRAMQLGFSNLRPRLVYVDDAGKLRAFRPEPIGVTIRSSLRFESKNQATKNVFDFLVSSFAQDYMKRRMLPEESGWRTLMDMVRHGNVTKFGVYGTGRGKGSALSELERRGVVETRVFRGERGRGGSILKVRIAYEKETVKRYLDQHVMKNTEK